MLKKALLFGFLLLSTSSLFASSALTYYRENGLANLEKQLDLQLTQTQYWTNHVHTVDTRFGYIEEYSSILTCSKDDATLSIYTKGEDNEYVLNKTHNAYTGKNSGDKTREGDRKTPVGIYTLTEKLSKETKLDPFYGPLAFVTSYPNIYDNYLGKNGHGIWIHGLPIKRSRDKFTKGCIAIKNSNIECIGKKIDIEKTLLIINSHKVNQDISKLTLASILAELYKWRYTWLYSDIDGYLSFYASDFVRSDGVNFENFKRYKTRVFKKDEKKSIIFRNINVIPYPNRENIYQITFKEFYKSQSFEFIGNKTLMVRVDSNGKIKIFTEK